MVASKGKMAKSYNRKVKRPWPWFICCLLLALLTNLHNPFSVTTASRHPLLLVCIRWSPLKSKSKCPYTHDQPNHQPPRLLEVVHRLDPDHPNNFPTFIPPPTTTTHPQPSPPNNTSNECPTYNKWIYKVPLIKCVHYYHFIPNVFTKWPITENKRRIIGHVTIQHFAFYNLS